MSTPLYKRWAPPKPTTSKLPPDPASPAPRPTSTVDFPPASHREREQKSGTKSIGQVFPMVKTSRDEPGHIADEAPAGTPRCSKKPKKRKREQDEQAKEDEATPKKHKAILSKFERSSKLSEEARKTVGNEAQVEADEVEEQELHDLEPLPQPAPVPEPIFKPTFSTLPTWLSEPITVEASITVPFDELGVHSFFLRKLEKQGYKGALAVQSVLLPMLHPGYQQHLGDVCVSARTGSGKTLAYLLPIIEALRERVVPKLSAIVVVPSRQLVDQALRVAEELCTGTRLKIGTAVGHVPFTTEQKQLVQIRTRYDPTRANELHERAARQMKTGFIERGGILGDLADMPVDHVPHYDSGVDILICTPGRLVEHIESTTGFLLRSVKWLVIDEADQLLNQSFQGWTKILMDALHRETPDDLMNAREEFQKCIRGSELSFALSKRKDLTKIVLSATIEKDLTKLNHLRLQRPKLVVVKDETEVLRPASGDDNVFELPSTLDEFVVRVGDGSNKPLYLLYLLLHHVFTDDSTNSTVLQSTTQRQDDDSSGESDSDSSESDEEMDQSRNQMKSIREHKGRVLIFMRSNENASRLSHLLSVLQPDLKKYLGTMSPSATAKANKKLLRSFSAGAVKVLIASDAASRGLDIPDITHVINYDMPPSVTSYVHRVGRTARAGKAGEAWTLFTKSEAAWFLNVIARGEVIGRGYKRVERVELSQRDVTWNRRRTYQQALQKLQGAVEGNNTDH